LIATEALLFQVESLSHWENRRENHLNKMTF
jgi:hypothetical protein